MEAIIKRANEGLKMVAAIVALLLAFLGIVAFVDFLLSGAGMRLNVLLGIQVD